MSALLPFLRRNWPAVLGALAAALLFTLLHIRTSQRDEVRAALDHCRQDDAAFVARAAAEAARVRAEFEARARRIEAEQTRITQETDHDYQARLAALRSDYERRLRADAGDPGQPGTPRMPALPGAAGGPDGPAPAALPAPDPFACEANSLQLDHLQRWLKALAGIDRDTATSSHQLQ